MADPNKQDILILLMGMTGAGKTTFINHASGSNLAIGEGLESCTSEVQAANSFLLDDHIVTLVDSPGFDDTKRSEAEILREVTSFLAKTYETGRLFAGIIYLHRITDRRVGGVARRNFSVFHKLCGESTLKNTVVVTNMWTHNASDAVRAEEEGREAELATKPIFFKNALDNGAHMARHDNTIESAHSIIREFFGHQPQPLLVQRELVDENMRLEMTDAGVHMKEELMAMSERYRKEIEEMREQQREQEQELAAANFKLQQNATLAQVIKELRGIIERLTIELKETREALHEKQRKGAKVVQQMEILARAEVEGDRRLSDTARQVEEGIRRIRHQQIWGIALPAHPQLNGLGAFVSGASRVMPQLQTQPAQAQYNRPAWYGIAIGAVAAGITRGIIASKMFG